MLPLRRLLCLIFVVTVSDIDQGVVCGTAVFDCMIIYSAPNILFLLDMIEGHNIR